MNSTDLNFFLPEITLSLFAMAALMFGVFVKRDATPRIIFIATTAVFLVLALWISLGSGTNSLFNNMLTDDAFGRYLKVLVAISCAGVLASSVRYLKRTGLYTIEFPVLLALSALGMMIMVAANNLMSLYIGLELQSLALYVLAAYRRDNARSSEAGMKYFVLGALSSGLFLFGASLVYGFSGTTEYGAIAASIGAHPNLGIVFGLAFLAAAIAFKISAAPFHMWTPDVYQGAPTAVTALFATAPKVAAIGMLSRLFYVGFADAVIAWQQILAVLALLSVFVGAIAAIGQTNIKRLLAYSSVLNMGFVLLALSSGTQEGLHSMLIFLTIYVVMSLGAFAFVMSMERDGREAVEISDLGQLSSKMPLRAAGFAVIMFSMAGIPPLAGFWGKYLAITAAVNSGLVWLAIAAVIASVIGAYYYLRLIYLMYFGEEPSQDHESVWTISQAVVFAISAILMLAWMIRFFLIENPSLSAAASLLG